MVAADAQRVEPPGDGETSSLSPLVVSVSRSKVATARNERTPLMPKPEEEVYPLPWFRSPEWTRRPLPPTSNPGRRRQGGTVNRTSSACPSVLLCCYNSSVSDAGSESDAELGYLVRRPAGAASEVDDEADSFKQCIQFLVGLIVIMAMALILLIIFQPKTNDDSSR
ncbi:hypothetical protein PRIC1_004807 [Phytophthora ramorum]